MNIKKQFILSVAFLSLLSFTLALATPVQAQEQKPGRQYQLLEKIPGTDGLGSDLPGYVSAIYKMALIIVTLSAVLMLTVGGFMYLTSAGNTASIGTAKGIIYDSLIGLIIALSAWLVLYIINPDLVEINLSPLSPVAPVGGNIGGAPGAVGALPTGSDAELATKILANRKITLASSGSCKTSGGFVTPKSNMESIAAGKRADKCTSGCNAQSVGCLTEAVNISNKMMAAMLAVSETFAFTVTSMSGGPHSSTSAHFRGAAIDVVPVGQALMDAFVKAGAIAPGPIGNQASSMCEDKNGKNVGCGSGSGADHMHLVFPN